MLIPLVALLIPASRIAPALYAWRIRSRIYRWYGELKFLEHEIREHFTAERVAAFMQGLDRIEEQANARPVPLAYTNELYILREHIDSGDALTQGIGAVNPERIKDFYKKTVDAGLLTAGQINPEASFTTRFVNKGTGLDLRKKLTSAK